MSKSSTSEAKGKASGDSIAPQMAVGNDETKKSESGVLYLR